MRSLTMPPSSISSVLLVTSLMSIFVACNAGTSFVRANGPSDGGNTIPPVTPQNVATIETATVQTLSLAVCMNCHNGQQLPDLSTGEAIKAHLPQVLTMVNSDQMPPPSSGFAPLTACQKAILNSWAQAGTPDDSTVLVSSLPECASATPTSFSDLGDTAIDFQLPELLDRRVEFE
jgi:hypothetical protein